jgi:hypothetical protein
MFLRCHARIKDGNDHRYTVQLLETVNPRFHSLSGREITHLFRNYRVPVSGNRLRAAHAGPEHPNLATVFENYAFLLR